MSLESVLVWAVIVAAGIAAGFYAVYGIWQALGAWRIHRAGPRHLTTATRVLWRDPGDIASLDLAGGPGGSQGQPSPPFRFLEEHHGGSQPCVSVMDAGGRRWRVKWGDEVNSETFAVRLAWACGYFAETTYFVPRGTIDSATGLTRASDCIGERGAFAAARFELDDPAVAKHFEEHSWAWNDNPFVGSRQLQGLKIVSMLLSNWDTKDRRDVARGSNTAIFEYRTAHGREARYLITDWGGSMGSWGTNMVTRGRWDAPAFAAQTPQFIAGVGDGVVKFGYAGQRTEDLAAGITLDDVRWISTYLSRISDAQIAAALEASGATAEETAVFLRALRQRIGQLMESLNAER